MLYKTHQAFGLFSTSLVLVHYTHTPIMSVPGILALGSSMILSVMPDADEAGSISAKSLFPIAMALEMLRVKHRGPTHSLTIAALWFWLAFSSVHWYVTLGVLRFSLYPVLLSAAVSYLSHIVIDFPNEEGEQLFWPIKKRFALYLIPSDGVANSVLEVGFLFASFFVVLYGLALQYPAIALVFQMAHHMFPILPRA